jgi:hypothetical protein
MVHLMIMVCNYHAWWYGGFILSDFPPLDLIQYILLRLYPVCLSIGAQYLNQRIHDFVEKYNAQHDCGNGPIIQIFNDHDVESCDYTTHTDGRHYHYLNMLRIRLFMNQVQCVKNHGANWK